MEAHRSRRTALTVLLLAGMFGGPEPGGQGRNGFLAAAAEQKPSCVRSDAGKGPKANPCPPGYVPAPGSKVPPVGSTDIGGSAAGADVKPGESGKMGNGGAAGGKGESGGGSTGAGR